jgi:integrase
VRSTFDGYHKSCKMVINEFGKQRLVKDLSPEDFQRLRAKLSKRLNPTTQGNHIRHVRTMFKYAYDIGLIDQPIRFGPAFKQPAKRILRALKQKKGPRMFEAEELRRIIDGAAQPLKSMILLGINCGFGNADCGRLLKNNLDLKTSWVDYPREKTAVERRSPLWPETVDAIREVIKKRTKTKAGVDSRLVFVTKYGDSWFKDTSDNPISKEMRKLLNLLKLHRPGLGFYALRHTFETIAGESRDQVAVNYIMGHADQSMAGVYRERISDERLQDVSDFVRHWLFVPKKAK